MFLDNTKTLFGRLMISIDGISLSVQDKQLIQNRHVGGLILFARNFQSQTQILELCNDIKNIKQNIIIAVDQEGGRVQRFQGEFTKQYPQILHRLFGRKINLLSYKNEDYTESQVIHRILDEIYGDDEKSIFREVKG